ncbi:MAG: AAA domain-containing protein [Bacteroidota bacterium]
MRQILHSYKLRLTNLSQGNRALKLPRLSKRRDIDLRELGFLEKDSPEALLEKIIAGKDLRLINRLDPRFEPTNLADRRLNKIYREVSRIFEETGTYDLYLGYPFVEGKFLDGTDARCPLLLFPVRLERDLQAQPRWQLKVIKDEPVRFNKTFFLAFEQFQETRLKAEFWEEEIDPSSNWGEWLQALYEKVKAYELDINFNSRLFEKSLDSFKDMRAEDFSRWGTGKLIFQPQAVLGIFPQSDSALLADYETLEQNSDQYPIEELFKDESVLPQEQKSTYIKEEQRFFVTSVDQSQEEALLQIKNGRSVVIHGPPGTGKSQVIVNIIADAMAHGQKVLVVSQKRAALDVVYHRLSALGLNRFAMLVHDYRHDRSQIYQRLRSLIEDTEQFKREVNNLNLTQWEHQYRLLSRQTDQYNREFEELFQALTQRKEWGISLHDLYLQSDALEELIPVEDFARRLDIESLEALIAKLAAIFDYQDLLANDYPWLFRLSFRAYGFAERQALQQKVDQLPTQLAEIHQNYSRLAESLSTRILEPALNLERIEAFREADKLLQNHRIREAVEVLKIEKRKTSTLEKILDEFEKNINAIDERQFLDDSHWDILNDLERNTQIYHKESKSSFSWLNWDYIKAKRYLKRFLSSLQLELDPKIIFALRKDIRAYRRLSKLNSKHYDRPFFHDFPLLNDQEVKREWLAERREELAAYLFIKEITFFQKIGPRFEKGRFDMNAWQHSMQQIDSLTAFTAQIQDTERDWASFLHPKQIEPIREAIKAPEAVSDYLQALSETFSRDFPDLKAMDELLANTTTLEQQAIDLLKLQIGPETVEKDFLQAFRNSVYCHWIEWSEKQTPILAEVSSRSWDRKRRDYVDKVKQSQQKVTELIQRRLKEHILERQEYNRLGNPVTYRTIYHQVSKKRRLWSVRKLVRECWEEGLQQLAPCWLASPESVSAIFPMENDFFDVIIFDEASQCYVERGIPVLLRGKQAVIAGDPKQLQPLDLYRVRYEDAEAEFVESEIALEVESLLDLARTRFAPTHLNWHYRSQEAELINFSNQAFYEGKLQVLPPAKPNPLNQPSLEWISVMGQWQNNRNRPEAERVIELIIALLKRPDEPSLGVVTFNYHQQELIKDLLDAELEILAHSDSKGYDRLYAALHKTEQEEFQGLFVKNIENVQGDERDIIIFSVGYAPNDKGRVNAQFGLLSMAGGENRLNVAISRARKKSYLICSFEPHQLQVTEVKNEGPRLFKDYLQYVRAISAKRETEAINLLNRQHSGDITQLVSNPIADYFYERLVEEGYFVERHFGETSYKLDLAVKDSKEAEEFVLGIECEGSYYFGGESAKEREVYRPQALVARGWKVHRIWARNFWQNRDKEWQKLLKLLP